MQLRTDRNDRRVGPATGRPRKASANTRRPGVPLRQNRPTHLHRGATRATVAPMPSPHPAARIAVDAEAWRAFRQAAIVRGIPVSVYLGRLVEAELGRRNATAVANVTPDTAPGNQALASLGAVRASIDDLDDIAGRLARSANELGGSWRDIASSLGLTEEAARRAYDRPRGPR